jgi:hypothetical protein
MSDAKQLGAAIQRTGDVMVKVGAELQGDAPDVGSLAGELTATAEALTAAAAPSGKEEQIAALAEEEVAAPAEKPVDALAEESVAAPVEDKKEKEEEDLEGLAAMGTNGGKKKKRRGGKSQRKWKKNKRGGRQTKKRR